MRLSATAWREIRGGVLAGVRAGIDTQRIIADELDRRAAAATGKRREKLARIATGARETAAAQEAQLGALIGTSNIA